jgi:hypothetical protein
MTAETGGSDVATLDEDPLRFQRACKNGRGMWLKCGAPVDGEV